MSSNQNPVKPEDADRLPLTAKKFWPHFANLPDAGTFYATWLAQQFARIEGARLGMLMLPHPQEMALSPVAVWPDPNADPSYLNTAVEQAMARSEPVLLRAVDADSVGNGQAHIACPLLAENTVQGVVVFDLPDAPEHKLQAIIDRLQWDMGWLLSRIAQQAVEQQRLVTRRSAFALDVLAVAEEHAAVEQASMAVANEIAVKMACDRVSIGLINTSVRSGARIRLRAMSHSAWYRKKTTLVDELENAMEEALDQHATVVFPQQPFAARRIFVAHKEYAENWKVRHITSVVLTDKSVPVGVLTLERREDRPFEEEDIRRAESIAALIGPVLDLKRRERRWVSGRIADALRRWSHKLFGPRHPALKLLAAVI